jgi:hypothetical protein
MPSAANPRKALADHTPHLRLQAPISNRPGNPQSAKKTGEWLLESEEPLPRVPTAELPTVVTETVTDDGVVPVKVTEFEDKEQVEPAGAPLQLRATVWLKPATGLTLIVKFAVMPGAIVCVDDGYENEKSCPVPLSVTVSGGVVEFSAMFSVPLVGPSALGSKNTPIEQLAPPARLLPQALSTPKAGELEVTLAIVTGPSPVLVAVTVCGSPEVPTYWPGKLILEGDNLSVGGTTAAWFTVTVIPADVSAP